MRIVSVGGGPAGLYFGILMKLADPAHEVEVFERHRPQDTFGFGVVFSDATLEELADADPPTYAAITRGFHHWDDIDIHYRGEVLSSTGHGFSGLARTELLEILGARCCELGVNIRYGVEVDSVEELEDADLVLAADGVNSAIRERYRDDFDPRIDERPNRFVWLGTTKPFPAFTFYFRSDPHGLWRVHAYQYRREDPGAAAAGAGRDSRVLETDAPDMGAGARDAAEPGVAEAISTFIVEATEETWRAAGLEEAGERETVAFCQRLFAEELEGHPLIANRSIWRRFPTVRNERWHRGNLVLIGDAAHTAHFSIGSGTRLAMVDAIALRDALLTHENDVPGALMAYEESRRSDVDSLQRAAQASLEWFEGTERYTDTEPIQFAFNLLTRSLRITHSNLMLRDETFTRRVDRWVAERATRQSGRPVPLDPPPPPLFTPFKLRELVLDNRVVVSAMCQYYAEDGTPDDWHLVHLGTRAIGGAGLVMSEMTNVSREGRISPGCTGMYQPRHVRAWRRIVDFVHKHSDAAIGLQLGHSGRKGSTKLAWEGDNEPLDEDTWPIMAASPIPWFEHSPVPREMDRSDMDRVKGEFVRAAEMGVEAGFDLLEIHFAHGYLLASFISPLTNVREDEYGGSLENRLRFPVEVLDAAREVWPEEKPLSVRISAVDWAPGGMGPADAVQVARAIKARGVDIIDVSAGQTVPYQKPRYGRQFQTPFSDRIRHEVGIATMAVGNISSFMDVNTIIAAGRADLCCLARAHLWEPYWTRHAAHASGHELRWPDPYSTLDGYTPRFEWGY